MAYWEFETRDQYYRRLANQWTLQARSYAYDQIASRYASSYGVPEGAVATRTHPLFDRGLLLRPKDMDAIVPKTPARQERGILGSAINAVDDVTSALFLGEVRQPWDLLRPVQRLLETEQKYVSKPLAKAILSPLGEYEDLPGAVRFGAEILTSPSTYIGPGALINITKRAPRLALAMPGLVGAAEGPGSRQGLARLLMRGTAAETDKRLAERLPRIAGGAPAPKTFSDALDAINKLPTDYFEVGSIDDMIDYFKSHRNNLNKVRQFIGDTVDPVKPDNLGWRQLITWVEPAARKLDVRLRDTGFTPLINARNDLAYKTYNLGNSVPPQIRNALKTRIPTKYVREVNGAAGTVVDNPDLIAQAHAIQAFKPDLPPLLTPEGNLPLSTLGQYYKEFDLTSDQLASITASHELNQLLRKYEKAVGIRIRDINEPRGLYFHREPLSRLVESADDLAKMESEEVRVRTGPPLRRAFGARQSAARPRTVQTEAEGFHEGIEYMPFDEAQGLRVSQGGRMIADNLLKKALDDYSRKPTALLSQQLVTDREHLRTVLYQTRWLDKELARASKARGSFIAPRFDVVPELRAAVQDAELATSLRRRADRLAGLTTVGQQVTDIRKSTVPEYVKLNNRRRVELDRISVSKGTPEFPVEFQGRYYQLEPGLELTRELGYRPPTTGFDAVIQSINDNIRPIMASFDLSFLGVQGLITLFSNPRAYFTAVKTVLSNGADDFLAQASRDGRLQKFVKYGGHIAARNDLAEFIAPRGLTRLPLGIGKGFELSNRLFTDFGNTLRVVSFDAGLRPGMTDDAIRQLARSANLVSGYTPTDPKSIERSALFAARFFRSQIGLTADAITKAGHAEGATRSLVQFFGAASMATLLFNELLGNETITDPTSSNFMRVRVAGKDVSLFGTWDTLLRAFSTSVDKGPDSGLAYLARAKASPALGRVWDLLESETFGMGELDYSSPEAILTSFGKLAAASLPISVQQALEPIAKGDFEATPESILGTGIEFLGIKATPLTPFERLDIDKDRLAQEVYGRSWDNLEPYQKVELGRSNDLSIEATTEIGKAFEARTAIAERFQMKQERIDQSLPAGREWVNEYYNLKREQAGAYDQWAELNPKAAARIRRPEAESNPLERKRLEFYQIFDRSSREDWSPKELSDTLDNFESTLTPDQQAYLERNTGLRNTPRVKEFKAAQETLRPYWEIEDTVWNRLRSRLPEGSQYDTLDDYVSAQVTRLREAGVPDSVIVRRVQSLPLVRQVERAVSELRRRYRLVHPSADRELVKWYGYQSVRGRAA